PRLTPIVSLGRMPRVNAFLEVPRSGARLRAEPSYPLDLYFCERCTLVQLQPLVSPALLFGTYAYLSSVSRTNRERLDAFADELATRFALGAHSRILEIGSNDGTLLRSFQRFTQNVVGVDPAKNVASLAAAAGVETIVDFFSPGVGADLARTHGGFDLILALNVVAHTPDFVGLFSRARDLLAPGGRFVIEVVHVLQTLLRGEIDTVYHEHVYCFSLHALLHAAKRAGLIIVDAEKIAAQGGSLRIVMQRRQAKPRRRDRVAELVAEERDAGVHRASTYASIAHHALALRLGIWSGLRELRKSADLVVGLGAPARGVVLMNYCGLTTADLDVVIDDTPLKQGKLVPGCHIPVGDWTRIPKDANIACLMFAWTYRSEILEKLRARTSHARVLIPLPAVEEVRFD
ncbi:MAG TPA: class I SAM-dependent methyltransferase, partial [Polyangia bacterium]|nr:class I SAM-dependent methyltransferase [Polyangia bacterium]